MSGDIIQVRYQELALIAQRFGECGERSATIREQVMRDFAALRDGGWQGKGSAAFITEMQGTVVPTLERLLVALAEAQSVVNQIGVLMRQAEEEASRPFRGDTETVMSITRSTTITNSVNASVSLELRDWWKKLSGKVHTGLDLLGFIPGIGAVPDVINGLIHLAEGNIKEAAFSVVAAVPYFGDAGKIGRYLKNVDKLRDWNRTLEKVEGHLKDGFQIANMIFGDSGTPKGLSLSLGMEQSSNNTQIIAHTTKGSLPFALSERSPSISHNQSPPSINEDGRLGPAQTQALEQQRQSWNASVKLGSVFGVDIVARYDATRLQTQAYEVTTTTNGRSSTRIVKMTE